MPIAVFTELFGLTNEVLVIDIRSENDLDSACIALQGKTGV